MPERLSCVTGVMLKVWQTAYRFEARVLGRSRTREHPEDMHNLYLGRERGAKYSLTITVYLTYRRIQAAVTRSCVVMKLQIWRQSCWKL